MFGSDGWSARLLPHSVPEPKWPTPALQPSTWGNLSMHTLAHAALWTAIVTAAVVTVVGFFVLSLDWITTKLKRMERD